MRSSIIIPPEILDHIFSLLELNDPSTWSTLKACSDTILNPLLRAVVDRRLYAHIVVTNFKSNRLPGQFYHYDLLRYLSSNPQVANYIRTFQIQIQIPGPSKWYDQSISILRMLPSTLRGICLSSRPKVKPSKIAIVWWPRLHGPFRKAFLNCLRLPYLTDVSMRWIEGVPLSIFNCCAKLERISFRQVDCTTSCSDPAQFPPQITTLNFDRTSTVPEILSWAQMGHNLRSLSFRSEREDHYLLLTKLFHSSSDTLIELELDFAGLGLSAENYPSLSLLPNLEKLIIGGSIFSGESYDGGVHVVSPVPAITRFVTTSPSLKRLVLHLAIAPWHINGIAKFDSWTPLDSLAEHPSLEHIELGVISKRQRRRDVAGVDMISVLMGVPELKQMCEKSFLSMERSQTSNSHGFLEPFSFFASTV